MRFAPDKLTGKRLERWQALSANDRQAAIRHIEARSDDAFPWGSFEACEAANSDADDPGALCAFLHDIEADVTLMLSDQGKREPTTRNVVPIRAQSNALLRQDGEKVAPNGEPYDHRFVASTERIASDGGVIPARAWNLTDFLKGPRWISSHDLWGGKITEISLGRVVQIGIENDLPVELVGPTGRALVAYVRYATTPYARQVRALYEEGGLDDVSVRWDWRNEEIRDPTAEEIADYAGQAEAMGVPLRWVADRVSLVELSAVLFGADPGAKMVRLREPVEAAVARCRAKGICMDAVEAAVEGRQEPATTTTSSEPATARLEHNAMADALSALGDAVGKFDAWVAGFGPIVEELQEQVTALQNLTTGVELPDAKTDDDEGKEPEKEPEKPAATEDEEDRAAAGSAGAGGAAGSGAAQPSANVELPGASTELRDALGKLTSAVERLTAEQSGIKAQLQELRPVVEQTEERRDPAPGGDGFIDIDAVLASLEQK